MALLVGRAAGFECGRGMATLKDMERRLKGVKNMKKITKAMKMVAQSKLRIAETQLKPARNFGNISGHLIESMKAELVPAKHLVLVVSTDRGLCGGVNSNIGKATRVVLEQNKEKGIETKVAILGDKGRALMNRVYGGLFSYVFNDFGKLAFNYNQASYIASQLLANQDFPFDKCTIIYNKYRTKVSYDTTLVDIFSPKQLESFGNNKLAPFEQEGGPDVMSNYAEHAFANSIYMAFSESFASEQSARMNAMEGASKNAGEMILSLQLQYNRTRQAVITRELIEIISGASAL